MTIVVVVVAAIVIFLLVGQGTNGSSGSTDEVPKVIGMNYDDAVLNYPNIEFEVAEQEYTDKYEENIIYKQNVEAGQFVKKNKDGKIELAVAVSKGIQKVQIPDLTNYTAQEAEDALKALGLTAEQKKTQSTSEENIEADHVIRTEPGKDEEVAVGSNVVIYVSQGIAVDETDVPKFIGHEPGGCKERGGQPRTQAGSDRSTLYRGKGHCHRAGSGAGQGSCLRFDR